MFNHFKKPVLGIAALSGTGKTQLLTQLIPLLKADGIRVAVIKHAHHKVDIDKPGKDSFEVRQAGANQVLLASTQRLALMIEKPEPHETPLEELLTYINADDIDLVLVEGYKELAFNKLFLFRQAIKGRHQALDENILSSMNNPCTLAIVTDDIPLVSSQLTQHKALIDINQLHDIKQFVLDYIQTES